MNIVLDDTSIDLIPLRISIFKYALLHIKCFKENNTPIVGNLRDRLGDQAIRAVEVASEDTSIGATTRVWGWKTIYTIADEIRLTS